MKDLKQMKKMLFLHVFCVIIDNKIQKTITFG